MRAKSRNEICPELFAVAISRAGDVADLFAVCGNNLAMGFLVINGEIRRDRNRVFTCTRLVLGLEKGCLFILSSSFHFSTSYTVGRWERWSVVLPWSCLTFLGYGGFSTIEIEPRRGYNMNLALSSSSLQKWRLTRWSSYIHGCATTSQLLLSNQKLVSHVKIACILSGMIPLKTVLSGLELYSRKIGCCHSWPSVKLTRDDVSQSR